MKRATFARVPVNFRGYSRVEQMIRFVQAETDGTARSRIVDDRIGLDLDEHVGVD